MVSFKIFTVLHTGDNKVTYRFFNFIYVYIQIKKYEKIKKDFGQISVILQRS